MSILNKKSSSKRERALPASIFKYTYTLMALKPSNYTINRANKNIETEEQKYNSIRWINASFVLHPSLLWLP